MLFLSLSLSFDGKCWSAGTHFLDFILDTVAAFFQQFCCYSCHFAQPRFSWAESNMINAMQRRRSRKNPFWLTHLAFFDSDNNESLATKTHSQLPHVLVCACYKWCAIRISAHIHRTAKSVRHKPTCMAWMLACALRRVWSVLHSMNNCKRDACAEENPSSNPIRTLHTCLYV